MIQYHVHYLVSPVQEKLHLGKESYLTAGMCTNHIINNNYCFFRGHGNESCNLIGSLPGQYFPISAHGPR